MDKVAKEVAEGISSDKDALPAYLRKPVKHSISATCQAHNEKLKQLWDTSWALSPRYCHAHYQDMLTPSSQKYLKFICSQEISRVAASHLFQLRVGHVPLNQYLFRFHRVDNPRSLACRHPKETVEHFILHCPKYTHERWNLFRRAGSATPKFTMILSSKKCLTALVNYIDATECFKSSEGPPQ